MKQQQQPHQQHHAPRTQSRNKNYSVEKIVENSEHQQQEKKKKKAAKAVNASNNNESETKSCHHQQPQLQTKQQSSSHRFIQEEQHRDRQEEQSRQRSTTSGQNKKVTSTTNQPHNHQPSTLSTYNRPIREKETREKEKEREQREKSSSSYGFYTNNYSTPQTHKQPVVPNNYYVAAPNQSQPQRRRNQHHQQQQRSASVILGTSGSGVGPVQASSNSASKDVVKHKYNSNAGNYNSHNNKQTSTIVPSKPPPMYSIRKFKPEATTYYRQQPSTTSNHSRSGIHAYPQPIRSSPFKQNHGKIGNPVTGTAIGSYDPAHHQASKSSSKKRIAVTNSNNDQQPQQRQQPNKNIKRHVKHIEWQLANLSESMLKSQQQHRNSKDPSSLSSMYSSVVGVGGNGSKSNKRAAGMSVSQRDHDQNQEKQYNLIFDILEEGKQCMKNFQFEKGIEIFSELLSLSGGNQNQSSSSTSSHQSLLSHSLSSAFSASGVGGNWGTSNNRLQPAAQSSIQEEFLEEEEVLTPSNNLNVVEERSSSGENNQENPSKQSKSKSKVSTEHVVYHSSSASFYNYGKGKQQRPESQHLPYQPHHPELPIPIPSKVRIESQYLLGVCCFHLNNYELVIHHIAPIIRENESYRKNMYLFLGISYKKLQMIDEALLVLSKGLQLYPKYMDILLLRAKILSKQKRYYDAVEDLNKCIKLEPENHQAYVSKADCLRNLSQFEEAIGIFTEILEKNEDDLEIVLKRAITYIENEQTEEALADLSHILTKEPKNSEAYLFKGLAYSKIRKINESILSYEQAIKFNTSKKATTKALYEISKMKIDMGDFYGASYTLERASSLDIDMKIIEKLKTFIDGATFIMKKKYRKGIELLNIISKKEHLNEQIRSLLYSFRSYGNFCQNKYASAYADLRQLLKSGFALDKASEYNMTVLEGIMQCQNNDFSQALIKFNHATSLRPEFGDPEMYKALCNISSYNRTPKLRSKNETLLQSALTHSLKAIEKEPNYNFFYLCSLVLYNLKRYEEALTYLEEAIEKSDEHIMKHFYLRAMIRAMQGHYKEAFTDLNNVLSIQKDLKEKEKEREEQLKQLEWQQEKEESLGVAGNVRNANKLMQQSNNNDDDDSNQSTPQAEILEVYLNRAKCFLLFGDKKKAFQDLQTYIGQKPLDNSVHSIAGQLLFSIGACEDAIKAYNYSPNIEKQPASLLSRVKCYIVLKELNLALRDMEYLLELGDKYIKFDFCCLSALKEASKGSNSTVEHFKSALDKISICETIEPKKGNIFSYSDMFFYKGVLYFMLKDYSNAKKYMTKSKNLKNLNNEMYILSPSSSEANKGEHEPYNPAAHEEEYEEQFENKIFVDKEVEYNIALCDLMLGDAKKAMAVLEQYEGFKRNGQQIVSSNLQEKKGEEDDEMHQSGIIVDLTPFPRTNRLCSIFSDVTIKSGKGEEDEHANDRKPSSTYFRFKLTFCLPGVHPPPIQFEIEHLLIEEITMSSIESRPDAPWIKRNKHGVIFTDEMILGVDEDAIVTTMAEGEDREGGREEEQLTDQEHEEEEEEEEEELEEGNFTANGEDSMISDKDFFKKQLQMVEEANYQNNINFNNKNLFGLIRASLEEDNTDDGYEKLNRRTKKQTQNKQISEKVNSKSKKNDYDGYIDDHRGRGNERYRMEDQEPQLQSRIEEDSPEEESEPSSSENKQYYERNDNKNDYYLEHEHEEAQVQQEYDIQEQYTSSKLRETEKINLMLDKDVQDKLDRLMRKNNKNKNQNKKEENTIGDGNKMVLEEK